MRKIEIEVPNDPIILIIAAQRAEKTAKEYDSPETVIFYERLAVALRKAAGQ